MKRASTTSTSGERLQKILSQAGVSSRRAAEAMIRSGRVTVNGHTTTELGTRANPRTDRIAVDGKPLRPSAPHVYLLLNKPVGVVTTLADPEGRPTVRDYLKGVRARVFPVGRLDYHSAGLLVLTNDGELALRLTHPRYGVHKTYQVKVKGEPHSSQLAALAGGVRLADGTTKPAQVHVLRQRDQKVWLSITLAEGKNRQVRRMCEAVGLSVEKLVRVAFGGLKLGGLAPGAWRHLEPAEIQLLVRPAPAPRPARPARGRQREHAPRGPAERRSDRPRGLTADVERRPRPDGARSPRATGDRTDSRTRDRRPAGGRRQPGGAAETARSPRRDDAPRRGRGDRRPTSAVARSTPPRDTAAHAPAPAGRRRRNDAMPGKDRPRGPAPRRDGERSRQPGSPRRGQGPARGGDRPRGPRRRG